MTHNDEWYQGFVGRLAVKIEELEERNRRMNEENGKLLREIAELSDRNGFLVMTIAGLKAKLECGDESGDEVPESLLHRYERRIQELSAELDMMHSNYNDLTVKNDKLEAQLKELQNDLSESEQAAIQRFDSPRGE